MNDSHLLSTWIHKDITALKKNQLCCPLILDLLPASRTERQYSSVVSVPQPVVLWYGSPSTQFQGQILPRYDELRTPEIHGLLRVTQLLRKLS